MSSTSNSISRLLFSLNLNGASAVSFRNRLVNGNFAVNQRSASDAPTVYEPGEFIRDRWRAGLAGCTAACKAGPNGDVTIHIGAGSILQVVEGALYLPEGGTYCLSWQGDAVGRFVAVQPSSFIAGPISSQKLNSGQDIAVEFSLPRDAAPVSLGLAQLEPGATPTVYERRDDELRRCQRYFNRLLAPPLRGVVGGNVAARCGMPLSVEMRAEPEITLLGVLKIFDGEAIATAVSVMTDYSTRSCLEIDLQLSSPLAFGRPAVVLSKQDGVLDLNAEMFF
ncbi:MULTISPECIES: hypothetical protein [unclassified Methylobacterium]|uniref:hypothetical protein n=1 Tax=unclassified Methylobacterium TaxID=2615210 RepID=UPI0011C2005F|nr:MULTISPECIES: hypothetical protein [unclassified Methylobacterium]QEE39039.1 hypothetical protein FVA80_08850 [Methylobacterium sp. WL1]TXN56754.1 hypothetical protein FV241_14390 [Methylobacterium sp. WL2]